MNEFRLIEAELCQLRCVLAQNVLTSSKRIKKQQVARRVYVKLMDKEVKSLVDAFEQAGMAVSIVMPPCIPRCFSVRTVADLLDVCDDWVRDHLGEFPGWFRLPGGGPNGGPIRIPARAVRDFQRRGLSTDHEKAQSISCSSN